MGETKKKFIFNSNRFLSSFRRLNPLSRGVAQSAGVCISPDSTSSYPGCVALSFHILDGAPYAPYETSYKNHNVSGRANLACGVYDLAGGAGDVKCERRRNLRYARPMRHQG